MKLLICIFFGHNWIDIIEDVGSGVFKKHAYVECKRCKLMGGPNTAVPY